MHADIEQAQYAVIITIHGLQSHLKKKPKIELEQFSIQEKSFVYKNTSSQTGKIWTVMEKWYSYSFNFKALSALASEQ